MSKQKKQRLLAVLGIVFSCVALLFKPLVFSLFGLTTGFYIQRSGNGKLGNTIKIIAVSCGIIGYILGLLYNF